MSKNFIIVLIVLVIVLATGVLYSLNKSPNTVDNNKSSSATTTDTVISEDLVVGTGDPAVLTDNLKVNYRGTLADGTEFDSSYQPGRQPFLVQNLGNANVIKGWNQGLVGMKVGGKRKLIIPPSLAYGSQAIQGIPANSTLTFEVELLEITKADASSSSSTTPEASTTTSQ